MLTVVGVVVSRLRGLSIGGAHILADLAPLLPLGDTVLSRVPLVSGCIDVHHHILIVRLLGLSLKLSLSLCQRLSLRCGVCLTP